MPYFFLDIAFLLVSFLFMSTTAYSQQQVSPGEETPTHLRDNKKRPDTADSTLILKQSDKHQSDIEQSDMELSNEELSDKEHITIPSNTPTDTLRAWASRWAEAYHSSIQNHQKHQMLNVIVAVVIFVAVILAVLLFYLYRRNQQRRIQELLLQLEAQQQQVQPTAEATAQQQQVQPAAEATVQQQQQTEPQTEAAPVLLQQTANTFLEQVNNVILRQMPERQLNTTTIAHELNLSPSQFRRRLAASTSLTPSNYILTIRMKKAKELLQEYPRYNIAEVAQMCGFADNAHFAHNFKRMFGMSPTKYINQK